jgi:hypothetical protein
MFSSSWLNPNEAWTFQHSVSVSGVVEGCDIAAEWAIFAVELHRPSRGHGVSEETRPASSRAYLIKVATAP